MFKKSFFIYFTCLCLGLCSLEALAQKNVTLSGYIRDAASGEDLIGATVQIKGTATGTITNLYGFYSLTVAPGNYTLMYSFVGLQTIEQAVDLTTDKTLTIELEELADQLDEVVVLAEAENQNVTSPQMSVMKMEAQQVKQIPVVLGESDIIKSIQLLPGVSNGNEGATGFNVRGGGADQNLILLDEAVLYNASHLLGFFSVFNTDAIKDIQLYKGGIPAQYGGRLSSVLDVRQREGNNKEFKGEIGVGIISARALVEGPIVKNKSSYMVAARRSYGDVFLAAAGNDNTAFFYDLNLKTNYAFSDRSRLFLSGYFGRDRFEIDNIFSNTWGNATATLRWNYLLSDKLFANVTFINSLYDYSLDIFSSGAEFRWTSDILTRNFKADLGWFINDKNSIDFGVSHKWYEFNPAEIRPIEGSNIVGEDLDMKFAQETALYASYEQKVGNKLTLQYGLRFSYFARRGDQAIRQYENNSPVVYNPNLQRYEEGVVTGERFYGSGDNIATFDNFEPRFSAAYVLNDRSSVKASYNRMVQYLHLVSNTSAPTPLDIWTPSGSYIDPQKADQYAFGYFRNFKDNMYEASVEVYYKDMQNLLDFVDGADLITNNYLETELLSGDGRAYGVELLFRKKKGKLTGWISYTLAETERRVTGLSDEDPGINNGSWYPANFDRRHDFSITGSYKLNTRWSLSANFVFANGIPVNYPNSRYNFSGLAVGHFDGRNQNRLPDYHRLDVGAILKGKPKDGKPSRHEWNFGLYNVYNRLNASSIAFRENEDTRTPEAVRFSLFGIVPSVSYNLKF